MEEKNKPKQINMGDRVAIVSLSSGALGEPFARHELDLGIKRLKELGLEPVFMDNALKGIKYLNAHPEARAADLKQAFKDKSIKMIVSAIGGDDSHRTLPYLLKDEEFAELVSKNPKIFTGYSDTTVTHLLLHKLGLNSFYGPAFLTDFAEFEENMLPYTEKWIDYFFNPKDNIKVEVSDVWYENRTDFSPAAVGSKRVCHNDTRGVDVVLGGNVVRGELLGGCLEVLVRLLGKNGQTAELAKYLEEDQKPNKELIEIDDNFPIFPPLSDWKGKIMFIETSDRKTPPENFDMLLKALEDFGVFGEIAGLIVGKPCDEAYYEEYRKILKKKLAKFNFPVMMNFNFGHGFPRMVLPYGALAELDPNKATLTLKTTTIV